MTGSTLLSRTQRLLRCDHVRISKPKEKMFCIIGWNRRSEGVWINQEGQRQYFDYVEEKVVASGYTFRQLWADTWRYWRAVRIDSRKGISSLRLKQAFAIFSGMSLTTE